MSRPNTAWEVESRTADCGNGDRERRILALEDTGRRQHHPARNRQRLAQRLIDMQTATISRQDGMKAEGDSLRQNCD